MTCWRRLRECNESGVWQRLQQMLGQPLRRPTHLYADRSYDHESSRDQVRRFEITPRSARRGTEHGSGLGVHRWVLEGAIALLHWFRRLRIRWEIRDDIHHAFITSVVLSSAGDG
ncbi:hypothetical protein [Nonomuraea indica]|uniref:Transposase n=1 Tax=Nonomuraea indica TaxID=1581193 RepID=A0ABW8A8X7_9ACTN